MIITDGVHVVSTIDVEHLHIFAKNAKLKNFHNKKGFHHYDLISEVSFLRALAYGALLLHPKDLIRKHEHVRFYDVDMAYAYRKVTLSKKLI